MYDELTQVDIQKMRDEIDYRTRELRPKLIEEVKTARAFGDLSENSEYDEAKNEQAEVEARINEIEYMLKYARVIDDEEIKSDVVTPGSKVVLAIFGGQHATPNHFCLTGFTCSKDVRSMQLSGHTSNGLT